MGAGRGAGPGWAAGPELAFALDFADRAGRMVREVAAAGFEVSVKADLSPVTTADRVLNDRFIDEVRERFPGDGVLGEEASFPGDREDGRCWVIDLVDGTQQFILGIPLFMVSIALVVDGVPVVAVAHNPSTGQTYRAALGGGAYRGDTRLAVSDRDALAVPVTVNGGGSLPTPAGLNTDGLIQRETGRESVPHRFPWPSVFSGCQVAEGFWEAELYSGSAAWDVAAIALLVTEAGGAVTDRLGAPQRYDRPVNGCILSNGRVHEDLVREWTRDYVPRR